VEEASDTELVEASKRAKKAARRSIASPLALALVAAGPPPSV